ncbi:DUF1534 domain-containing protein [Pseudomonas syringae pv. avii]|nr:DUF1534 domain-containing protein [Pseudomonas syringae pv. avii]
MRRGASHDNHTQALSFRTLQRGNALRDAPRHRSAPHREFKSGRGASRNACDAERRTIIILRRYRSARSSVGMPCVTLRVTDLRRTAHSRADAERPETHATRSVAR